MNEIMEEYGGIMIAFLGAALILAIMAGLMEADGSLGRAILWFGNNAC